MILLTGASGFLGHHVKNEMNGYGLLCPTHAELNLLNKEAIRKYFAENFVTGVIHCAGTVGGIGLNKEKPYTLGSENLQMGINLIEECLVRRTMRPVDKFILISTVCGYPAYCPAPFMERDIGNGQPEPTNRVYGLAKNLLGELGKAARQEHGMNFVTLYPANMIGEHDNFGDGCHVVPAIIKKIYAAQQTNYPAVELWGSGKPTREFLYGGDAARGIRMAWDKYNSSEPVNIGTGESISIKDLAEIIADLMGYDGEFVFDQTNPDGQLIRRLCTERAKKEFGFTAKVELREALGRTVDYFFEKIV
jgi:nucleoside-diphosphate-sugar epimerase